MMPITTAAADVLRVRDVTLDLARQVVRIGPDDVRLRPKTFDVLTMLVRHAGQVVSKQRLIEAWGDVAVTDDSLVQCLVEIRRALGDDHVAIRTVRGRGYLLDGEMTVVSPASDGGHPPAPEAVAPVAPPVVAPRALRRWVSGAVAALGSVLVLQSGFGVQSALELLPLAGASARRAVALDPTLAAGWQALAHMQTQGDWDWAAAEQSYRRAIALDPSAQFNVIYAHLLVGIGRLGEAREVLRAVQARAVTTYVPPVELAFLLAAVGERALALEALRAHRLGGPWMVLLAVHPAADPLRAEPRFRALLTALRLPELS